MTWWQIVLGIVVVIGMTGWWNVPLSFIRWVSNRSRR